MFGVQIKRMKTLTLNDLRGVFHLTIKDAAAQIGISVSGIKTICRRENIAYWPQRKVQWCMQFDSFYVNCYILW